MPVPPWFWDVRVRVLAIEEQLASKLFVLRRERFDGVDIAHTVFASQGNIDWDRVFRLVKEHWEILLFALVLYRYVYPAYSHYVPSWVWRAPAGQLFARTGASESFGALSRQPGGRKDVCYRCG
jgi:hypothetical protein